MLLQQYNQNSDMLFIYLQSTTALFSNKLLLASLTNMYLSSPFLATRIFTQNYDSSIQQFNCYKNSLFYIGIAYTILPQQLYIPLLLYFINIQMLQSNTLKMTTVLANIHRRYCFIFFSKLMLYGDQETSYDGHIRHYDVQCQAAQNITRVLQNKLSSLKLLGFHRLKTLNSPRNNAYKKIKSNAKTIHETPHKGNKNDQSMDSLFNPISYRSQRTYLNNNRKHRMRTNPQLAQLDISIEAIMQKVKNLNQRFRNKKEMQREQQQMNINKQNERKERRKMIFMRLNQLENELSGLADNSMSYIKKPNSQLDRTFCTYRNRKNYSRVTDHTLTENSKRYSNY